MACIEKVEKSLLHYRAAECSYSKFPLKINTQNGHAKKREEKSEKRKVKEREREKKMMANRLNGL